MNRFFAFIVILSCLVGCGRQTKPAEDTDTNGIKPLRENAAAAVSADSLDFVLSEKGVTDEMGELGEYHRLTEQELRRTKAILTEFVNNGGGDTTVIERTDERTGKVIDKKTEIEQPLPLDHYYKQYIGYVSKGHLMVRVNLAAHVNTASGESVGELLSRRLYVVHDGGKSFGNTVIDLTRGTVVSFSLNGSA